MTQFWCYLGMITILSGLCLITWKEIKKSIIRENKEKGADRI